MRLADFIELNIEPILQQWESFAREIAPGGMALQGNLDPQTLVVGGEALERAARDVLIAFKSAPHIFNLGHGVTPDASPQNVAHLVRLVKGGG